MAEPTLPARSPIRQAEPIEMSGGWEVSARRADGRLRLADLSPLVKLLVRGGQTAAGGVAFGRARRHESGPLIVGSRPGEWTVIGAPQAARRLADDIADDVVDLTHGLALLRLTGDRAADLLATLCAVELDDAVTPQGAAFTSSVAKVVAEVVRDDVGAERSYLLSCDRSYGQYLWDVVLAAGAVHGLEVDGFCGWG